LWHQFLLREGSELHKPHPVRVGSEKIARHLQGQPRLARAARSRESQSRVIARSRFTCVISRSRPTKLLLRAGRLCLLASGSSSGEGSAGAGRVWVKLPTSMSLRKRRVAASGSVPSSRRKVPRSGSYWCKASAWCPDRAYRRMRPSRVARRFSTSISKTVQNPNAEVVEWFVTSTFGAPTCRGCWSDKWCKKILNPGSSRCGEHSAYLNRLWRAGERTRTADLPSLRVMHQTLLGDHLRLTCTRRLRRASPSKRARDSSESQSTRSKCPHSGHRRTHSPSSSTASRH
jgi:hypothetical protein